MRNKQKLWLKITTIVFLALTLLIIGSPSFINSSATVSILALSYVLLLPIVAISSLIYLYKSLTSKEKIKLTDKRHWLIDKLLAVVIALSLAASAFCALDSLNYGYVTARFALQNTAYVLIGLALVGTIALGKVQGNIFWANLNKNVELDERQIALRQTIIEKSYRAATLLLLISALFAGSISKHVLGIMQRPINHAASAIVEIPFYSLVVAFLALPMLVAAYQDLSKRPHSKS